MGETVNQREGDGSREVDLDMAGGVVFYILCLVRN